MSCFLNNQYFDSVTWSMQDKEDRRTFEVYPHFEDVWVGASVF